MTKEGVQSIKKVLGVPLLSVITLLSFVPSVCAANPASKTTVVTTFTHHSAGVNGIVLHYVMAGKGEPVVLLHGWPETWYMWRKVMPELPRISR